jgi:hypothetical protein
MESLPRDPSPFLGALQELGSYLLLPNDCLGILSTTMLSTLPLVCSNGEPIKSSFGEEILWISDFGFSTTSRVFISDFLSSNGFITLIFRAYA